MDPALLVIAAAGLAVAALIYGVSMLLARPTSSPGEERLAGLSGQHKSINQHITIENLLKEQAVERGNASGLLAILSGDWIHKLYQQADLSIPYKNFILIVLALAAAGAGLGFFLSLPIPLIPAAAAALAAVPLAWLWFRKRKRIKMFTMQFPDALELVGRALRAGHGLSAGLHVVAVEMPAPMALEFGRVFEEQNLGIPLEDALRALADRVPTMDVRFFVTAVVIQRTTGGDLAEILDKIGHLIRERFQILGQVQALTGEGRVSGVVLMAMAPALLALCYMLNPPYTSLLFTHPVGKQMLMFAGIMQILGALAIKKIVAIKI